MAAASSNSNPNLIRNLNSFAYLVHNLNRNPPGQLFYPSDVQLVFYYLAYKNRSNNNNNNNNNEGFNMINELNVYDYRPFELPETAFFRYGRGGRKKHWYCYTKQGISQDLSGGIRLAMGGYWKRSGRILHVEGPDRDSAYGRRTKFVFNLVDADGIAVPTDWIMYEYSLVGGYEASFVLCRVFFKPRVGVAEVIKPLPPNAEEMGFSACINSPSVQLSGVSGPTTVELVNVKNIFVGESNDASGSNEVPVNDQLPTRPFTIQAFLMPSGIQEPVGNTGLTAVTVFVDAETAGCLHSIQEGNFIEVNDLTN